MVELVVPVPLDSHAVSRKAEHSNKIRKRVMPITPGYSRALVSDIGGNDQTDAQQPADLTRL